MKYKAGDKVTIVLSEKAAHCANIGYEVSHTVGEIITHEPAPEPVVGYVTVRTDALSIFGEVTSCLTAGQKISGLPVLKLTYNPATKQASVEVVG